MVGRHLFIGITGTTVTDATRRVLRTVQPGGVVLFTRNVDSAPQLSAFTAALRREVGHPLIIAIDQEHGRVNRLRNIVGELPTIPHLQADDDPRRAAVLGGQVGGWLRGWGVDLDFAPVLDLELFGSAIDNALRERCWGRTPSAVTTWAGAFLRTMQAAGVAGCGKHFPGLGAARQDSHDQLPIIDRSRNQLIEHDLAPYRALATDLPAVMVGHGYYPALDGDRPVPASLSERVVSGLLREELGFDGLVVTDDLEMGAVTGVGSFEQGVVRAFRAGADALLIGHSADRVLAAHAALERAAAEDTVPAARWEQSRRRLEAFGRRWIGSPN